MKKILILILAIFVATLNAQVVRKSTGIGYVDSIPGTTTLIPKLKSGPELLYNRADSQIYRFNYGDSTWILVTDIGAVYDSIDVLIADFGKANVKGNPRKIPYFQNDSVGLTFDTNFHYSPYPISGEGTLWLNNCTDDRYKIIVTAGDTSAAPRGWIGMGGQDTKHVFYDGSGPGWWTPDEYHVYGWYSAYNPSTKTFTYNEPTGNHQGGLGYTFYQYYTAAGSVVTKMVRMIGPYTKNNVDGIRYLFGASNDSNPIIWWHTDRTVGFGHYGTGIKTASAAGITDNGWIPSFGTGGEIVESAGRKWLSGTGSPEGAVTATVGTLYTRTDGGTNTTLYVKETGSGNTGWVGK